MKGKISVIIPVYNVEPYLRQCLDSVIKQTYRNLEIIIIDDGSPDNCGMICDEYAAKDERIVVIHKENAGLSSAWNDGMKNATGEWIAFIDSDDWVDTDYFEKLLTDAESMGLLDADVIIAGGRIEEKEKAEVVRNFISPKVFSTDEEKNYLKVRIHYSEKISKGKKLSALGYPWDKMFRLQFIRNCDLWYDESMKGCADMLFDYCAFDMTKKVIGCAYFGYHYRFVTTGISKKYTPNRPKMFHDYLDKLYDYINARGNTALQVQKSISAAAIGYIASSLKLYYFHNQNRDGYRETARKICKMKQMPQYHAAIWAKNNQYMTAKSRILKIALRLPFVWPIKLLYDMNEKVLKR